ncbi:MAG: hypothetical protein U0667_00710 [Chloroflexota bacterium]
MLTNLDGAAADVLEAHQAKYEATDGFRAVVFDGRDVTVVVDDRFLAAWRERLAGSDVRAAPSCVGQDVIDAASQALRTFNYGPGDFASAGYDALSDAVIVHATFDTQDVVRALEAAASVRRPSDYVADARRDETLRLRKNERGDATRSSRTSDSSPFRGGARIHIGNAGCTTGFYIDSNTNGTVMVTAGHCSNGNNGRTVWNGNDSEQVGTTEGVRFPNPDLVLIDGAAYNARSYAWNDQTTTKAVTGSANPTTGVVYCQFGATTLRVCYAYDSLSEQFCDESGCTNSLAFTEAPQGPNCSMGSGGDSGGGVHREVSGGVSARGIVIARGGDAQHCYAWDHKRQTVLNTYDATVVTQ